MALVHLAWLLQRDFQLSYEEREEGRREREREREREKHREWACGGEILLKLTKRRQSWKQFHSQRSKRPRSLYKALRSLRYSYCRGNDCCQVRIRLLNKRNLKISWLSTVVLKSQVFFSFFKFKSFLDLLLQRSMHENEIYIFCFAKNGTTETM